MKVFGENGQSIPNTLAVFAILFTHSKIIGEASWRSRHHRST